MINLLTFNSVLSLRWFIYYSLCCCCCCCVAVCVIILILSYILLHFMYILPCCNFYNRCTFCSLCPIVCLFRSRMYAKQAGGDVEYPIFTILFRYARGVGVVDRLTRTIMEKKLQSCITLDAPCVVHQFHNINYNCDTQPTAHRYKFHINKLVSGYINRESYLIQLITPSLLFSLRDNGFS